MNNKAVRLNQKIKKIYCIILSIIVLLIISLGAYLSYYHEQLYILNTQAMLKMLVSKQVPYIHKNLKNGRNYIAILRAKLIISTNRKHKIDIGIYKDGETILSGRKEKQFKKYLSTDKECEGILNSNDFFLVKNMMFSRQPRQPKQTGKIYFTSKINRTFASDLKVTLSFFLSIIVLVFLLLFLYIDRFIKKMVMIPIHTIITHSPVITGYINSDEKRLSLPTDLGSYEFNLLLNDLSEKSKSLKDAVKQQKEQSKHQAIAKTFQMLAHDIKKPFFIIQVTMNSLIKAESIKEIYDLKSKYLPVIKKAQTSIKGMIEDILEMGKISKPVLKPISLESLIYDSLNEIYEIDNNTDYKFIYYFNHRHMANIDSLKMMRVISNIIGNATQVMKNKDKLRFYSKEDNDFITLSVENTGSYIPSKDIEKLFEAFYTKDKIGGTGLGLVIAKKIVTAHGGEIWCESSKKNQTVKFSMTLPISPIRIETVPLMPTSFKKIIKEFDLMHKNNHEEKTVNLYSDKKEIGFENKILEYIKKTEKKIIIGIIEDDVFYQNALMDLIDESDNLRFAIEFRTFSNFDSAKTLLEKNSINFLICDINLGAHSMSGIELVSMFRASGIKIPICMHSDSSFQEDYEKSMCAGAQSLIPKPMTRVHLLKFIHDYLDTKKIKVEKNVKKDATVAVLDDEDLFIDAIKTSLNDAFCCGFSSCEDFLSKIEANITLLDTFDGIITDRNFDEKSMKGEKLVLILKEKYNYKKPIMFNTMDEMDESELNRYDVPMNLGKENEKNWGQLLNIIENN